MLHPLNTHSHQPYFSSQSKTKDKNIFYIGVEVDPDKPRESFKIKQELKHRYGAMPFLSSQDIAGNRFNLKNWQNLKQVRTTMAEGLKSCSSKAEKIWYCASPLVQWTLDTFFIGIPFLFRILTRDTDFINISPSLRDFNQAMHIAHANRISSDSEKLSQQIESDYQKAMNHSAPEEDI